jgi:hypothetical protein
LVVVVLEDLHDFIITDTINFKFQYFYSNFISDQTRFTLWRAVK